MNSELKYHRLFSRISDLEIRMKRLILFNYVLTILLAIALFIVATKAISAESSRTALNDIYYLKQNLPDDIDSTNHTTRN